MQVCTFFGHRNAPEEIKARLKDTVEDLIINHNVTKFYVGNEGSFDRYARSVLSSLCEKYTHIKYYVVLAYVPTEKENGNKHSNTAVRKFPLLFSGFGVLSF